MLIETPDITLLGGVALCAYLIGSIPFGIISTWVFGLDDLRRIGSGNIGATNVLRTGNKRAALLTLLGDAIKGGITIIIVGLLFDPLAAQIAALAAFLGHCYSVFLRFRGGKGMAIFIGMLLVLDVKTGIAACLTWLIITALFRISSLSAIITASIVPLWLLAFGRSDLIALSVALAMLLWFRHRANIRRILGGKEPRIGH